MILEPCEREIRDQVGIMSARGAMMEAVTVAPWELTHLGYSWRDMPGCDLEVKKLNFFLFRRGLLDLEEGVVEEDEALQEVGEEQAPRRPLKAKRWNPHGARKPQSQVNAQEMEAERLAKAAAKAEEQSRRETLARRHLALRGRLGKLKQEHVGALRAIAREAKISPCACGRWLNERAGLSEPTVERLERAIAKAERGELRLSAKRGIAKGEVRGVCPPGYVRLKDWVAMKADALGVTDTAIRMRLLRDKSFWPRHKRENKRVVWVEVGEMRQVSSAETERRAA